MTGTKQGDNLVIGQPYGLTNRLKNATPGEHVTNERNEDGSPQGTPSFAGVGPLEGAWDSAARDASRNENAQSIDPKNR